MVGAFYRAAAAAVLMLLIGIILIKNSSEAIELFPVVLVLYWPISYYTDVWLYRRRQRQKAKAKADAKAGTQSVSTCGCSRWARSRRTPTS